LGATSQFRSEELDLPKTGTSQITVYLPDDSTLQATNKSQLPFKQLSSEAREANILPGLTKSLLSVNKMAENGSTTIFRPGDKGVTIHIKGTLTITTSKPPVLQGCKQRGAKFGQYQHQQQTMNTKKWQMYTTYHQFPKQSNTSMLQQATQSRKHGQRQ
jgi:hypothetical protein